MSKSLFSENTDRKTGKRGLLEKIHISKLLNKLETRNKTQIGKTDIPR
jgi:hypothetical protein